MPPARLPPSVVGRWGTRAWHVVRGHLCWATRTLPVARLPHPVGPPEQTCKLGGGAWLTQATGTPAPGVQSAVSKQPRARGIAREHLSLVRIDTKWKCVCPRLCPVCLPRLPAGLPCSRASVPIVFPVLACGRAVRNCSSASPTAPGRTHRDPSPNDVCSLHVPFPAVVLPVVNSPGRASSRPRVRLQGRPHGAAGVG